MGLHPFRYAGQLYTVHADETEVVALSSPVVALLRTRWNERTYDTGLVFSNDGKTPIRDMTMTKLLRGDGVASLTVHGF